MFGERIQGQVWQYGQLKATSLWCARADPPGGRLSFSSPVHFLYGFAIWACPKIGELAELPLWHIMLIWPAEKLP